VKRKKLATICLFLVITAIILGLQTYVRFDSWVTIGLILLAALFSYRANKSLVKYGWF
jgi:predicted Na+-dependent transporter